VTWFKVDDSFHSHPKVLATSPAALGLWVVAGAWCGANLTDGFVPDYALPRLIPDSAELAAELVRTGLWKKVKSGHRFHDWNDYNPNSSDVKKDRDAARERMRKLRANRKAPAQAANGSGEQKPNVRENFADRSQPRPVPSRPVLGGPPSRHLQVADARENDRDDDGADARTEDRIIGLLAELTGRTVDRSWASHVRSQILDGRRVDRPAAYVDRAIRERPRHFLPADEHPSSRSVAEALRAARGEA
jgi:hypothetical protein